MPWGFENLGLNALNFLKEIFFRGVAMEAAAELEAWRVGFNPQMIH